MAFKGGGLSRNAERKPNHRRNAEQIDDGIERGDCLRHKAMLGGLSLRSRARSEKRKLNQKADAQKISEQAKWAVKIKTCRRRKLGWINALPCVFLCKRHLKRLWEQGQSPIGALRNTNKKDFKGDMETDRGKDHNMPKPASAKKKKLPHCNTPTL